MKKITIKLLSLTIFAIVRLLEVTGLQATVSPAKKTTKETIKQSQNLDLKTEINNSGLEIKLIEDKGWSEKELLERYDGSLPEGFMIVSGKKVDDVLFYLVPTNTDLTGKLLRRVRVGVGGMSGLDPIVTFEFNSEGAEKFYKLTSENIGRDVAILVNGKVLTAPRVNAPISSSGGITGNFTQEEAQKLVDLLKKQIQS